MARIVVDELVSVIKPELDKSAARSARTGLQGVGRAAERAEKKADNLRSRLSGLARRGLRVAATGAAALGTAVVAAAAAVTKATNEFAKSNDQLVKTADNLGLASDSYQELRFAADRSGISTGELDKGIKTLNKNLGDLQALGTGPAAQALRQLGLEFTDLQNKSPDEQLEVIADALANTEDIATRTSAATALLGRSGTGFLKLAEDGSSGIRQLRAEARRYGAVIDEDVLRQSEAAVDAQANLDAAFGGVTNTILSRFIPSLAESKQGMADFLVENRELIGLGVDRVFDAIGSTLEVLREAFTTVATAIAPFLEGFYSAIDIFAIMRDGAFQVIDAISTLVTSFTDLFGVTDETINYIGEIVGSVIGETVTTIFDFFSDSILRVAELLGDLGDTFDYFAEGNFLDGLKHIGQSLIDFLLEPLRFIVRELTDLADAIPGGGDLVPDALRNFAQGGGVATARKDNRAARDSKERARAAERDRREEERAKKAEERRKKREDERKAREEANAPTSRQAAASAAKLKAQQAGDAEFLRAKQRGLSDSKALELAARAEADASGRRRGGGRGKKDAFSQLVQSRIDEQVKQAELAAGAAGGNAALAGKKLRKELSALAKQGDVSRLGIDPTLLAGGASQAGVGPSSTTPIALTVTNINLAAGAITGGINIDLEKFDGGARGTLRDIIQPVARQIQITTETRRQPRVQ